MWVFNISAYFSLLLLTIFVYSSSSFLDSLNHFLLHFFLFSSCFQMKNQNYSFYEDVVHGKSIQCRMKFTRDESRFLFYPRIYRINIVINNIWCEFISYLLCKINYLIIIVNEDFILIFSLLIEKNNSLWSEIKSKWFYFEFNNICNINIYFIFCAVNFLI